MTIGYLVDTAAGDIDRLSARLASGRMSTARWQAAMAKELADYHTAAFMLGTAERLNVSMATLKGLSHAERADINTAVHTQRGWLAGFVGDIESGDLSPAQIRARARSYAGSVKATYWQAVAPGLPFYPGDGCQCHTNCHCHWQRRSNAWWWMLGGAIEHCDDCRRRADGSPYEASE